MPFIKYVILDKSVPLSVSISPSVKIKVIPTSGGHADQNYIQVPGTKMIFNKS